MHGIPIGLVVIGALAIALVVAIAMLLNRRPTQDMKQVAAPPPPPKVDEGTVARIAIASDEWGTTAHILFEEKPGVPVALGIDPEESAIPLTQAGDRVRIEREDEEGEGYEFHNLTTGLSVTVE